LKASAQEHIGILALAAEHVKRHVRRAFKKFVARHS